MKSNLITRALALMLAVFTVAVMLVACAQTGKGDVTTDSPDQTTAPEGTESETVAETKEEDDLPEIIDANGYDYFIYCKDNKLWFEMYACEAGSATGDVISDALYARETYIENLYKCNITMIKDSKIADKLEINIYILGSCVCETHTESLGSQNLIPGSSSRSIVTVTLACRINLRAKGLWYLCFELLLL